MKILRFPVPPADRAMRAGSARAEPERAGPGTEVEAASPTPASRTDALLAADGERPPGRHAPYPALAEPGDARRLLWALTILQQPTIEALLSRRAPARAVLWAFRMSSPFGADERLH